MPETDITFVSSERPSTDCAFPSSYDYVDSEMNPWLSSSSDQTIQLSSSSETNCKSFVLSGGRSSELNYPLEFSSSSNESARMLWPSQSMVWT